MNIALLTWEFPPFINGGLGRYVEYYTEHLIKDGHKIWVYTYNTGNMKTRVENGNLVVTRPLNRYMEKILKRSGHLAKWFLFYYYNYASYRAVKKLCRQSEIDIVSVQDWMSCFVGILCKIRLKVPVVFHVHNTEFTMTPWGKHKWYRPIAICERMMARLADSIIAPSEKMREILVQHGWKGEKIEVIRHGFNEKSIAIPHADRKKDVAKQLREKWGLSSGDKILLFVGRLIYAKGIFYLIEAMQMVVKNHPEAKLIIAGTGDNEAVRTLIRKLNLDHNVYAYYRFLSKEEILELYQASDIGVFPSLYEPFGLVALEAMSFGKPVILGDGFPEFFRGEPQNVTALYVDSIKPQKIAEGIQTLLDDHERASEMGKAAFRLIRDSFDWKKTFTETIAVYQKAIDSVYDGLAPAYLHEGEK